MSAYTGKEAKELIATHHDIAVILLDVVMEEDDSGLKYVKYLRDEEKNYLVRVILRTGQPGFAPENKIVVEYDINDYKTKTELTSQKLFTTMITALRTYKSLRLVEESYQELQKYKNHLEKLVEERTYQLQRTNNQLQKALAEVEKMAITDKLTGLYNRHKLDEVLFQEFNRQRRYAEPFSFSIIDVDYFKRINDGFGHLIGDVALQELSEIIRNNIRQTDTIARWGGEEFAILAPNTSLEQMSVLAEKIRLIVAAHEFEIIGYLTISLGIAQVAPKDTITSLIKRADDALYLAKQLGRNRIVHELELAPGEC